MDFSIIAAKKEIFRTSAQAAELGALATLGKLGEQNYSMLTWIGDEWSPSPGDFTSLTSKKLKLFH